MIAPRDPGVPNWLDTGGRSEGLLILRWFWPSGADQPAPTATVVAASTLAADPVRESDTRTREGELDVRRRHMAWRFRT